MNWAWSSDLITFKGKGTNRPIFGALGLNLATEELYLPLWIGSTRIVSEAEEEVFLHDLGAYLQNLMPR